MDPVTANALLNAAYCYTKASSTNIKVCTQELYNIFKAAYAGRYPCDLVDYFYKPVTCYMDVTCSISLSQNVEPKSCSISLVQHN